jgi:hypothetical protein
MRQALGLERYAELTARMTAGEKRSDVLKSVDVDEELWELSQQYWLGKMAAEAEKNRFALSRRYAALFKSAQTRLAKASPRRPRVRTGQASRQVVVHAIPPAASVAPAAAFSSSSSPSAPPPSTAGPYAPRLTVEQLAAMRAEIATSPETEHPAVLGRFGLDATAWPLEEAHWQRRLARDQDLFARYLRQFQYCKSLLQRP